MSVVYKYPVYPSRDAQEVEMPSSSQIVSAIVQNGTIFIYAVVPDPLASPLMNSKKKVLVVGTGAEFRREKRFIATVQDGPYVWHVFEAYVGAIPV